MRSPDHQRSIAEALDVADEALHKLDAGCCDPGRSPRMAALGETLGRARTAIADMDGDVSRADAAIGLLEDAGSQIGTLQVTCCAPARMPLYSTMLENLMSAQLSINRAIDRGH